MPPDQIVNQLNDYTEKIDTWALGSIYYELLVGMPPFYEKTIDKFKEKMSEGNYEFPETIQITPEAILFISRCLQFKEENRFSVKDLC